LAATFSCVISVHQTISFFFQLELLKRLKRGRMAERSFVDMPADQLKDAPRNPGALRAADTSEFIQSPPSVVEGATERLEPVPRAVRRD
jgi:hypothetical protein